MGYIALLTRFELVTLTLTGCRSNHWSYKRIFAGYLGFEPRTTRLTVESSTAELIPNLFLADSKDSNLVLVLYSFNQTYPGPADPNKQSLTRFNPQYVDYFDVMIGIEPITATPVTDPLYQ